MNSCENLLKRGAIILPVHSSKCSAGVSNATAKLLRRESTRVMPHSHGPHHFAV